jgi:FAD/FMN-containing dehydrogenase
VAGRSTIQDSLLIDLSALMTVVLVDPRAGVARAQGGATWGMFNRKPNAMASRPRAAVSAG